MSRWSGVLQTCPQQVMHVMHVSGKRHDKLTSRKRHPPRYEDLFYLFKINSTRKLLPWNLGFIKFTAGVGMQVDMTA